MKDARPQQALTYNMDIKITGNSTSSPKKYSWNEVTRDPSGSWIETGLRGTTVYDSAYEYNNSNVTANTICQAKRDPRTGQVLFFSRAGGGNGTGNGTGNCPNAVSLQLGWSEQKPPYDKCSKTNWMNLQAFIGWQSGETLFPEAGDMNVMTNGTAVIEKITVEYAANATSGPWIKAVEITPSNTIDPRKFPYYFWPPAGISMRARYKASKVAVVGTIASPQTEGPGPTPSGRYTFHNGIYCELDSATSGEFTSPVYVVKTGDSVIPLAATFKFKDTSFPSRPTLTSATATALSVEIPPNTPAITAEYFQQMTGKKFTMNFRNDMFPSHPGVNMLAPAVGAVQDVLPAKNGIQAMSIVGVNRLLTPGCTAPPGPDYKEYPLFCYSIPNMQGGLSTFPVGCSVEFCGWVGSPDQYGYGAVGSAVEARTSRTIMMLPFSQTWVVSDMNYYTIRPFPVSVSGGPGQRNPLTDYGDIYVNWSMEAS